MIEYFMVSEHIYTQFQLRINELLKDGWTLYGNPFAGPYMDGFEYCQAMIRNI